MLLTLELEVSAVPFSDSMLMTQVVQKRLDYIRYGRTVPQSDVGVEFLGWEEISANDVLNIVDLSASLAENSALTYDGNITIVSGQVLPVSSLRMLVTDQINTNNAGVAIPLFYRHDLLSAVTELSVQETRWDGIASTVDPIHYSLDSTGTHLFLDLKNWFDEDTGRYRIYYVNWIDVGGVAHSDILNARNAYNVATLDDIDPFTGMLLADAPAYLVAGTVPNYTLTMSHPGTYYLKETTDRLINVLPPTLTTIADPWFLGVTDGGFSSVIGGTSYAYSVPDFAAQNFNPIIPFLKAIEETAIKITPSLVKLQREDMITEGVTSMYIDLVLVDKATGDAEFAVSNNPLLIGTSYSTTSITYTDSIEDIDQPGGIVRLKENLVADKYRILASYSYEAKSYELTSLNLNPYLNPSVLDTQVVVYIEPDVGAGDTAIWYLLVQDNIIVEANQPEFTEVDALGVYNPLTAVGGGYSGGPGSWSALNLELLILAEITVASPVQNPLAEIDLRVAGGGIDPLDEDDAIRANPRTAYLAGVAPAGGYPWPQFGSLVVEVPYTLHLDYGGELTSAHIRDLVQKHMSAGEYAIIRYSGVIPEWGCGGSDKHPLAGYRGVFSELARQARLTWYNEDPSYSFNIYQADSLDGELTLIASVAGAGSAPCNEYTVTGLTTGNVYYFLIKAVSPTGVISPGSGRQGVRII